MKSKDANKREDQLFELPLPESAELEPLAKALVALRRAEAPTPPSSALRQRVEERLSALEMNFLGKVMTKGITPGKNSRRYSWRHWLLIGGGSIAAAVAITIIFWPSPKTNVAVGPGQTTAPKTSRPETTNRAAAKKDNGSLNKASVNFYSAQPPAPSASESSPPVADKGSNAEPKETSKFAKSDGGTDGASSQASPPMAKAIFPDKADETSPNPFGIVPPPKLNVKSTDGNGPIAVANVPPEKRAEDAKPAEEPKPAEITAAAARPAKLTPKQTKFVKAELLPTYYGGDPLPLLQLVAGQLPRWTDPQVAGINQLLAEEKAPTLDKMLTDARMNLARAGLTNTAPEPSAREVALVLRECKRQVEEILNVVRNIELMKDPFLQPKSLTEFRDQLWTAHVQNNQLINADVLVTQGDLLTRSRAVLKGKNATAADKAIFAINFVDMAGQIKKTHVELNERGVELRVARVKFAVDLLARSEDVKERFFAAYAVGIDGELLLNGFKDHVGAFSRDTLNAPGYVDSLRSDVDRGKELAGDLVKKSQLLFAGMHWWRRGRYGQGPEMFGLLKSKAALTSLQAQIPLLMPRVAPVPVDPAKSPLSQIPDYDRRHHYTWAWQTRQFQVTGMGSSSSSSSSSESSQSTRGVRMTPDFWKGNRFY